jgi:hypothetical protein
MDDGDRIGEDQVLRLQLELHLDDEPISGRVRTEHGADERFVGWLGFVDALKRLREIEGRRPSPTTDLNPTLKEPQ